MTTKDAIETLVKFVKKYGKEEEYYLAPNDRLSTLITSVELKDPNFNEWA